MRWIHAYYLKHANVMNRTTELFDYGIFKAILQQRNNVNEVQTLWDFMLKVGKFCGMKVYHRLLSDIPNVLWCSLVLHNRAMPRAFMICHGKLATRVRLHRWGMVPTTQYLFCDQDETIDHLFLTVWNLRGFGVTF